MRPADAPDAAAPAQDAAARAPQGPQVVLTSPGRRLAVIDGEIVPLGPKARGVLPMHPGIEKKKRP